MSMISQRAALCMSTLAAALAFAAPGATAAEPASGAAAALPAPDAQFVKKAAEGGLFEVRFAKLVAEKSSDSQVKSFAQMLNDDHTAANDKLQQIASSHGLTLPAALPPKMQKDLDKLGKLSGAAFDKEVRQMAVKDHQHDIADFTKESRRGKASDVKDFAAQALPTLQKHLAAAQKLTASKS